MRRSWNRVLQAALSGWLVGLLAAGPALAQQPAPRLQPRAASSAAAPKLTVVVVPLDPPAVAQAPRLMHQAEQAVVGAGRFELVRLADALDAQGAGEREAKAREAAAALQEGLKAYEELDTQKALAQFDKAAQLYESSDLSRHFEDMSRARVMKIASLVANGDKKGFQRELKEVLARNPRAEFSPNFFPPDDLAFVERTRKGIQGDANKSLEVRTGGVVAQIYMDGQFWGTSPQTLQGLTPSEHFVTVIAPGYALAQGKFRGEADLTLQPLPSAPRLKAWMDRITADPEGEDRDAALRELGALVTTHQVLALVLRGSPGAGTHDAIAIRLNVSDGHNLGYATAPVPLGGEAMVTGIQSLLATVLQTDVPRKGGPTTHYLKSKSGSGRRTAGYVLLGTGAALVAGGVYFGLQATSKADEFKRTPQTDARASDKLRSDGKTFALIADVGVIVGLVSAGLGSWLAFTGGGGGRGEARSTRETASAPQPADGSGTGTGSQGKASAKTRAEEERRAREEAKRAEEASKRAEQDRRTLEEFERLKREQDEANKREEDEERRKREVEDRRRREEEARRKREQEEQRKREEEEKKKRPPLDEDDLRNY
jgi:hypothetical protein